MIDVILFLAAIVIIGVQYYLSRRNNQYWGAILPVIYIAFFVYGSLSGVFKEGKGVSIFLAAFGGTVVLLSLWVSGRQAVKDKRKKELEKIELHNL
jgi:hypothetical protein